CARSAIRVIPARSLTLREVPATSNRAPAQELACDADGVSRGLWGALGADCATGWPTNRGRREQKYAALQRRWKTGATARFGCSSDAGRKAMIAHPTDALRGDCPRFCHDPRTSFVRSFRGGIKFMKRFLVAIALLFAHQPAAAATISIIA